MSEKKIHKLERENKLLREQVNKIQNQFEEKISELSMAREIGLALLHVNKFEEVCKLILEVIIKNTVAQNCSIMLLDKAKNQLFLACASDPVESNYFLPADRVFSKENVYYSFKQGEGAAGMALRKKQTIVVNEVTKSSSFSSEYKSQVKVGCLVAIPLLVEDQAIGVLNISHGLPDIFEPNDVNLFNIIANFIALAIHSTLNHEKLKYSEAKYRALTESSNDGIAVIQQNTHLYANPKYQELSGYSVEELGVLSIDTILPGETDPLLKQLDQGMGTIPEQFEARLHNRRGMVIPVGINSSIIQHDGKKALIISVRDLTARKKLEKQLQYAQKMEAIGTLAGAVAHDLNNILSGIASYPELMLLELPQDSPMVNPLQTILNSGKKAAAIVQDLLALARRGVSVTKVININHVLNEYLDSSECTNLLAYHKKISIKTELRDDLFNIVGSQVHISRVIMNLVINAAEAMHGEGEIIISTYNKYIDKSLKVYEEIEEGEYAVLSIHDRGIGIAAVDLDKIFEPFFSKKVLGRSGTGLGLAVVWGTIKDHDGFIDVNSTEGMGTTFTIYFPAVRQELTKTDEPVPLQKYLGKGESILVVDDVLEQRTITMNMLEKLGYLVTSVASGEEALEHLYSNKADLIVLDMIMEPGIDGLETYQKIIKIHPEQKAIIVSGFSETQRVKRAQKLGAGPYLKKPFMLQELALIVKNELTL